MKKLFTIINLMAVLHSFSYAQVNLRNGLIAYYPFNGDTKDYSGNNYDLVYHDASLAEDRNNQEKAAYSFNGSSDYMTGLSPLNYGGTKTMSVSVWFKTTQEGLNFFINQSNSRVGTTEDNIYLSEDIDSTNSTNSASGIFKSGEWTHFIGTYDGTNITAYVNGNSSGVTKWPGTSFSKETITIAVFGNDYWSGTLDEVYLYNRVLNKDEIQALFQGDTTTTITAVGVTNIASTKISLYPSPAADQLTVDAAGKIMGSASVTILDLAGNTIRTSSLEKNLTIPVSGLVKGVYLLKISDEAGMSYSGKFFKE